MENNKDLLITPKDAADFVQKNIADVVDFYFGGYPLVYLMNDYPHGSEPDMRNISVIDALIEKLHVYLLSSEGAFGLIDSEFVAGRMVTTSNLSIEDELKKVPRLKYALDKRICFRGLDDPYLIKKASDIRNARELYETIARETERGVLNQALDERFRETFQASKGLPDYHIGDDEEPKKSKFYLALQDLEQKSHSYLQFKSVLIARHECEERGKKQIIMICNQNHHDLIKTYLRERDASYIVIK